MSDDILEAKCKLPLPKLLSDIGLKEHAKRSALCPLHEDKRRSFSIWQKDGGWFWKCHAGCGSGDEINFLEAQRRITRSEATKLFLQMAGSGSNAHNQSHNEDRNPVECDWRSCVAAFNEAHIQRLTKWRGYSEQFCAWLRRNSLIGLFKGCFAFPVREDNGGVYAAHYRLKDSSWRVWPEGARMRALVIGDPQRASVVHVFESQWDAFAVCDKLELHEKKGLVLVITRGAGNGALVAGIIPPSATVFAWKQNDELKNGKRAGDEWVRKVAAHADAVVRVVTAPPELKDANEWTLSGATNDDLESALGRAEKLENSATALADLLEAISAFLRYYVVFQNAEQPIAIALWVLHAWTIHAFDYTPYLHVASPEKQCGKTRLLDCLELLTPKPWRAILPSEAVLFRTIEKDAPTLLLDELDAVFTNSKDERKEALRALLNAGFERKATIPRCVGQNQEVKNFAVFCAKALAGIGKLPDTVRDRSIPIQLVRRSRDEKVERFRKREAEQATAELREQLEAWSQRPAVINTLRRSRPSVPDALSDRQADICEPLLAIAEVAGSDWPKRARTALIALCRQTDEDDSMGVKLLSAIRDAFTAANADRLSTQRLLELLVEQEGDAPWAIWWEQDLGNGNTRGPGQKLARLLKPFRIKARGIRLSDGATPRGYCREDFVETWKRFCTPDP